MIKVFLVEDSPVALNILKKMLGTSAEIEVIGTATTGIEALALIPKTNPDVICTDLYMPKMDGLTLTSEIMANYPRPILVVSAAVQKQDSKEVFDLLDAGAVDVFPKPDGGLSVQYEETKQQLINKIKILSGIRVFTKNRQKNTSLTSYSFQQPSSQQLYPITTNKNYTGNIEMIAIGASTGGPNAFQELLGSLPNTFPLPILCVQHISEGFLEGFLAWLQTVCSLKVMIAQHKEKPQPGVIYFPPENCHLSLDNQKRFDCSLSPPVDNHCPSVTVLLESIARVYGKNSLGILLTGMGKDGARGLLKMAQADALTIAQDESTSVVFGMPQEAIKLGAVQLILPIEKISSYVLKSIKNQSHLLK